jgi:hypothetical protein
MKTKFNSTPSAADAKSRDQVLNRTCAIRGRWLAVGLGGLLMGSLLALLPSSLEAQCGQWNVSGGWYLIQGNDHMTVDLQQNGNVVTGTVSNDVKTSRYYESKTVHGTVDGTVEGDNFNFQIFWPEGLTGVYQGKFRASGRLEGKTHDKSKPSSRAVWHSDGVMKCADAAVVEPTAPTPKPKSSGKMPAPAPVDKPIKSSGKMPKETVPTIKANPVAVTIPQGQSHGRTTLTWDGGPDHPDAEVWMKDTQGKERLVVQQGKGTRSVTVELGKNYQVILMDAGEQLARAAVLTRQ